MISELISVESKSFGTLNGSDIKLFVLRNASGLQASVAEYGATLTSLLVPDRSGNFADVVLGYDTLQGYAGDTFFLGSTIGRYGNRIANGTFALAGRSYSLPLNNGRNHLHGGPAGFHKRVWSGEPSSDGSASVQFSYLSLDGEEGYPGNLAMQVTYTLTADNELRIEYAARTDQDTVINVTNHSYFNLAGADADDDILGHELTIDASRFTPVDEALIPTGELRLVKGSPFDFCEPTLIGARINDHEQQLRLGRGYDHNFVLDGWRAGTLLHAARLSEPNIGRVMDVLTTEPGMQFYSGNFLDGSAAGKRGTRYGFRKALCLETQHFPDSPNQPAFPTTVLRSGQEFSSTTIFRFSR